MRDPITWSFPLGRMFGIHVRVHILLPLVMLGLILRVTAAKDTDVTLARAAEVMALLFLSILLHEFGHCFAARSVDGDAEEVLLWPLGGLAYCDLPHTPRAHLITALGGPFANLLLCVVAGGALAFASLVPPFNPFDSPYRLELTHWPDGARRTEATAAHPAAEPSAPAKAAVPPAKGATAAAAPQAPAAAVTAANPIPLTVWQRLAGELFWLNWFLLLINVCLPGFPLDGGRVLQSILWARSDYRQATATASYAGFIVMLVIGVFAIVTDSVLAFALALFVYVSCKQQLILLETGGEDAPFGYDFSQGYTSLEGSQPAAPPQRRLNWFQRWMQRRAARKAQREIEQRESEERRMDELLDKVQRTGLQSLTDEERRFLTRVSARYRGGKS